MLGLSLTHIILLAILGLILIGPKQLPEVAKTLGRLFTELRRATNMLTDEMKKSADHFKIEDPPPHEPMMEDPDELKVETQTDVATEAPDKKDDPKHG
jgi:sec-independent protein translocase protein TatB